jgi:hypothetical protein
MLQKGKTDSEFLPQRPREPATFDIPVSFYGFDGSYTKSFDYLACSKLQR